MKVKEIFESENFSKISLKLIILRYFYPEERQNGYKNAFKILENSSQHQCTLKYLNDNILLSLQASWSTVRIGRCHGLIFSIIAWMMFMQCFTTNNEFTFSLIRGSNLVVL